MRQSESSKLGARLSRLIALLLVLGCMASSSFAQPIPSGPEFGVREIPLSFALMPNGRAATHSNAGGFIVVWADGIGDGDDRSIGGRPFDATATPLAGDLQVNTYTTGEAAAPAVAPVGDGFVVVWEADEYTDGTANRPRVLAQRLDASGAKVGTEWMVANVEVGGDEEDSPDVAAVADGFVVVWGDWVGRNIAGALFDSNGDRVGDEFLINEFTLNAQIRPAVSGGADGFVVTWVGAPGQGGHTRPLVARRYDAMAAPIGTEFLVSSDPDRTADFPDVWRRPGGSFVAAWRSTGETQADDTIQARAFARNASAVGDEFAVTAYTTDTQNDVAIGGLADGRYLIAWESFNREMPGGISGAFAQFFDRDHSRVGPEFRVNAFTTNAQAEPSISGFGTNEFLVTWSDKGAGNNWQVNARRLSAPGSPGTTLLVTTTTTTTTLDGPTTTSTTTTTTSTSTTTTTLPNPPCGDPVDPPQLAEVPFTQAAVTASDALFVLQAATGTQKCARCTCDVNDSGAVTATDALAVLRAAVGQSIELVCPPC